MEATVEVAKEALKSGRMVLLDFWSPSCPPCKALNPTIASLAAELKDSVEILKLNIDEAGSDLLSDELNVQSLPTLVLFSKGAELARRSGWANFSTIKAWIENHL
jgi:thioredoxin 1